VADHEIPNLGAAVEEEVEVGEVGQEVAPELGIDGRDISEGAQFDAVAEEKAGVRMFFRLALDQKGPCSQSLAGLDEKLGGPALHFQLGKQDQLGGQTQFLKEIADNGKVEVQEPFIAPGEGLRQEGEMLR
jgi:hypothetical protein